MEVILPETIRPLDEVRKLMEKSLKRLTVDIPKDMMEELKLLSILHKKPMREIIIDAIMLLASQPSYHKDIKDLKYKLYRLEYENSESK